jgi:hypothetical protein
LDECCCVQKGKPNVSKDKKLNMVQMIFGEREEEKEAEH